MSSVTSSKKQGRPISRRSLLKASGALGAARSLAAFGRPSDRPSVAVIGAGAFGGWTALNLVRRGAKVTLLDAWGPGNARASSGGETRVIRALYGPNPAYVKLVARARQLWRENEARWKRQFYYPTGILWLPGSRDQYERTSLPLMKEAGFPYEELTPAETARRYPQVNFEGVKWVLYEKEGGYLTARKACEAVWEAFLAEGGEYKQRAVKPVVHSGDKLESVELSDGSKLSAERYVFACGPWLGKVFPDVAGNLIHPTRQEVFFFGVPAGDPRFLEDELPLCIDNGEGRFGAFPANRWWSFKVMSDFIGPTFDPTDGDRQPTAEGLRAARRFLAHRFPALKDAPLVEARVCQYENTPDHRFILDRHPRAGNVWLMGGGSGHGFKHGPALGERMAQLVLEEGSPDPFFSLSRFSK